MAKSGLNLNRAKDQHFNFTIPCSKEHSLADIEGTRKEKENKMKPNDYRIIIAEDEEHNFYLLKTYLQKLNLNFLYWAKNGKEVVDFIMNTEDTKNIIVLMDIKMPVMDGIKALYLIKDINPEIPVIAITAYATVTEKEKIIEHNFNGYIAKPLKLQDLSRAISKLN